MQKTRGQQSQGTLRVARGYGLREQGQVYAGMAAAETGWWYMNKENWKRHFKRIQKETEKIIARKKQQRNADSCPATTGGTAPGSGLLREGIESAGHDEV